MSDLKHNASWAVDWTAYEAVKRADKGKQKGNGRNKDKTAYNRQGRAKTC